MEDDTIGVVAGSVAAWWSVEGGAGVGSNVDVGVGSEGRRNMLQVEGGFVEVVE